MKDYSEQISRLKERRDYFVALEFEHISNDYTEALNIIEELIEALKEKESINKTEEEVKNDG